MADFLDRALAGVVPKRDVPAAEAITTKLCDAWPADDAGWETARAAMAKAVAQHLRARPEVFARALHLTALYLDQAELDEPHPHHQTSYSRTRRGNRVHVVELGLAQALAEAILTRATPEDRRQLYASLDEWGAWRIVAAALARLQPVLEELEIVELLSRAVRFTSGDMAAGSVLNRLRDALAGSSASVDRVLEGWVRAAEPYVDLDLHVVALLALWRLPQRDEGEPLRRQLVHQLSRTSSPAAARLALQVALRSWPSTASKTERSALFLATLDRLDDTARSHALAALAFTPDISPPAALELFDAIVARGPEVDEATALQSLVVLRWLARHEADAVLSKDEGVPPSALVSRLPPPELSPPRSRANQLLDEATSDLAESAGEAVRGYLLTWLERHQAALEPVSGALDQLFPLTRLRLPGQRWLVEAAVSPQRPALRRGALLWLLGADVESLREDFDPLNPKQVLALAHLLLGQAHFGAKIIDLLFGLVRARSDCLEQLAELLGEPAMRTYPGRHQRCVTAWAAAIEELPSGDPQRNTVLELQALIEASEEDHRVRRPLWSLLFEPTQPTRSAVREAFQRQVRAAMQQHESPILALATKIPIACGEAWTSEFGDSDARTPSPLREYSQKMEGLLVEAYDPLAASLARVGHEQAASELLDTTTEHKEPA